MVQALEHHRAVKDRVGERHGFGAAGHEQQPLLRTRNVLGVLHGVHLQPHHLAARMAQHQAARQPRVATTQFDDALPGQRHQVAQHIEFVAHERQ
ncbi:hypothetical protein D9M69_567880 [compost metagenome]